MKRFTMAIAAAMVLVAEATAQQRMADDDRPRITVTGEAVVNVRPDKIVISLGIETVDPDVKIAKEKNGDVLKKVLAALERIDVAEKDVQTDHLSIEPRWRDSYRREGEFIGYFVRTTLIVTVTDPARVEEVVTRALQSGVNYIHGVDFQTTEFKQYREQARELALKAAREKAEKMAAVLDCSVGMPLQVNEQQQYGSPWWYYSSWSGWGYGRGQAMSQNVLQNAPAAAGDTTESLALGRIGIRANVSVTFELKP